MPDQIDEKILRELRRNSKIPITTLAKIVGRSRTAVRARIDRLESSGQISYYTIAEPGGYEAPDMGAIILVTVAVRNRSDELIEAFQNMPSVISCHGISGGPSFALLIRRSDPANLSKIIECIYRLEGVTKTETVISLETVFKVIPDHTGKTMAKP